MEQHSFPIWMTELALVSGYILYAIVMTLRVCENDYIFSLLFRSSYIAKKPLLMHAHFCEPGENAEFKGCRCQYYMYTNSNIRLAHH